MNTTDMASALQALRKNRRGGRPAKLRPCKRCGQKFSARQLRAHIPQCRKAMRGSALTAPRVATQRLGLKYLSLDSGLIRSAMSR